MISKEDITTSIYPKSISKAFDVITGCSSFTTFNVEEIDCTDTDDDGVIDSDEDLNNNGNLDDDDIPNYLDDDDDGDNVDTLTEISEATGRTNAIHAFIDTDNDLIENYIDNDDDGDGVLTIDEDYNNNGDPTDDDTNNNMVPDYLENSVALSTNDLITKSLSIYPNPASHKVMITLNNTNNVDIELRIYDVQGKMVFIPKTFNLIIIELDVSKLNSGLYFVQIKNDENTVVQKLIIE